MLLPLENVFCMSACIMVLIQLLSSFGKLNGVGMPLELLHDGVNSGKSMDFARRLTFPLANSDNGVEVAPNIEENMELSAAKGFFTTSVEDNAGLEDDLATKSEMPKWLQKQQQLGDHQHANYYHSNMLPKHVQQSDKHHHDNRHQSHSSVISSAAASPLRRCSIEISSKIPGICQGMGSIGNACVSGDYIDVFNAECL